MSSELESNLVPGVIFKEIFPDVKFIKLIEKHEMDKGGYKIKDGLNEQQLKIMNNYINGGIEFHNMTDILRLIKYSYNPYYIRYVDILDDSKIYIDKDSFVADKVILGNKINIENLEIWNDSSICNEALNLDIKFFKYIKNMDEMFDESFVLDNICRNPSCIEYITNPTNEMMELVIDLSPYNIRYIKNPSLEMSIKAIKYSPYLISYINNLDDEILMKLVKIDPDIIKHLDHVPDDIVITAIMMKPSLIRNIKYMTQPLVDYAFSMDIDSIAYIPEQYITYDMSLISVKYKGDNLKYVPDKYFCLEIIFAALEQNGKSIRYLKNPSVDCCMIALNQTEDAIHYIENPTDEMYAKVLHKFPQYYYKICDKSIISTVVKLSIDELIKLNPEYIKTIDNITYEQCIIAVKNDGRALTYIPDNFKTNELFKIAIENDAMALKYISEEYQTEELCLAAIQKNPDSFEYIKKQTSFLCLSAVLKKGMLIKYIKDPSSELIKQAIESDPLSIQYIDNQTDELCNKAMDLNIDSFQFIKTKTFSRCLNAVKKKGELIKYIDNKGLMNIICEEAIKNDPHSIEYIPNPSHELILFALNQDGTVIKHIKQQLPEYCNIAVNRSPLSLKYILYQTPELCFKAVSLNEDAFQYIEDKNETMCIFCCLLRPYIVYDISNLDIRNSCLNILEELKSKF